MKPKQTNQSVPIEATVLALSVRVHIYFVFFIMSTNVFFQIKNERMWLHEADKGKVLLPASFIRALHLFSKSLWWRPLMY